MNKCATVLVKEYLFLHIRYLLWKPDLVYFMVFKSLDLINFIKNNKLRFASGPIG